MNNIDITCRVSGFYKFEAVNINTGKKRLLSDWHKNLITDGGMDRLAGSDASFLQTCYVGTGSGTPSFSDVYLSNRIATATSVTTSTNGCASTAPYYTFRRRTYRFSAWAATVNLTEVGVGWGTSGVLFSRSLILDESGNPTTITVLSDEYLDVTYEFRFYAPVDDVSGTVILGGNTYSWTSRASNAASGDFIFGWGQYFENGTGESFNGVSTTAHKVYSGAIGTVIASPSGSSLDISLPSFSSYTAGSYSLNSTLSMKLSQANFAGGIGAIKTKMGQGSYQIGFSPAIPKTSSDILSLTFTHSWARM